MAIDGSFRIDNALNEFLHSHLELASHLSYLSDKGGNLVEEELIDGVAELILHPRYTLRLVGCFRPIVRKIVDRVVALLHLVPDLSHDSDDSMLDFDEGSLFSESGSSDCEVVSIINSYKRCERGLRLHEISCLAFSRMLALVPNLLGSVREYFKFAPPPFKRIVENNSLAQSLLQDGAYILDATRASYRLLLAKPEVFGGLWNWSCYTDLVHEIRSLNGGETELLMDIRWSAVQILIVVLKTNDRLTLASPDFGFDDEEAFGCHARWKKYTDDVPKEQAIWYLEPYNESTSGSSEEDRRQNSLSLGVGSTNWSNMDATWDMHKTGTPFVITSAVKKSFEMVMLFVSQRWPVLLEGPAGAGKTALISRIAQGHGSQVLSIHMDEQIDGKTLVGSYVCAEQPGEFRWQPGSLTQAILNGLWVVFEDIDKAPADVQSILLPLLEGSTSFLTGHGEAITVNEGFRLFSTVSSSSLAGTSLGEQWRKVMVQSPSSSDLETIVKAWYPDLESLCGKLIETLDKINQVAGFQLGSARRVSTRDLLKWCKRIAGLGFHFFGDNLPASVAKRVYQEAVDVFAASSSSGELRIKIMKELAAIWELPISSDNTLFPADKPVVQDLQSEIHIGRVTLSRTKKPRSIDIKPFVGISTSLHTLERLAVSVKFNEPVLLVGETGTGKTTLVQNLAARLGQKLTVLNLSQQSDIADLLGGFKPMNAQFVCFPLYREFEILFASTFSSKNNEHFLASLRKYATDKKWNQLCNGLKKGVRKVIEIGKPEHGLKRKRPLDEELLKKWDIFSTKLEAAHAQINASDGMVFSFVEGVFITALKKGEWILLDEINLAPPETLQRVIGVLEDEVGSLCLAERGDVSYISRHPNFRIFACMNPATDAGKRDLPLALRSRFTEYFMDDGLSDEDLVLFINQFMEAERGSTGKVLNFYKTAKKVAEEHLQDGANQKPQYSLRSLYRALEYSRKANLKCGSKRAIYDGFAMFFLSMLDPSSAKVMDKLIERHLLDEKAAPHYTFDRYFDAKDCESDDFTDKYELTESVRKQLCNLARAIFAGKYPVLLQGPTSSGKTSLVQYLAAVTGHEFIRINNHEHTDLQEYLGSYITDATGKLVFQEGVLVKAVRHGHWIVLDELNLAPSDVLEALNRLLDDNRELYVPELCETIKANENFMLFATQNPPTFYGGRKMLSRAFRNRFVEIHVDEIPQIELIKILEKRCAIDPSNAGRLVGVMKELQSRRQSGKIFDGKLGFITPRDLFRWANRFKMFGKDKEDLGRDGYYLLAERLRDDKEKQVVLEVLQNQLRIELPRSALYKEGNAGAAALGLQQSLADSEKLGKVVWTESMQRLFFLVERCYRLREPVLLVGETGGGKTTVCQLLSLALGSKLHILNCHQYTETSDFLGGFYPVRERSELALDFKTLCEQLLLLKAFRHFPHDITISLDINQATTTLDRASKMMKCYREGQVLHHDVTPNEVDSAEEIIKGLSVLHQKWCTIFNWQDGPLVQAMKNGDLFLVDEISLADDSVLERLNSVLEPERKLSLAEKGGSNLEKITAHENFFILATMNPGGDFGKKELSPALRNRFTEIWVPPVTELNELKDIALNKISNPEISFVADAMINFWKWFNGLQTGRKLTVRDLLSWIDFVNVTEKSLHAEVALLHGAFLVLLDGLSLGTGISKLEAKNLKERCLSFLMEQLKESKPSFNPTNISNDWSDPLASTEAPSGNGMEIENSDLTFGIHPFYIEKGDNHVEAKGFEFLAPTTRRNSWRVLRAMRVKKPVLLEGSPGVGKTSLVLALGKFSGHSVVRINLSEQTDMMDLLGSDLPVESDEGMQFAWSDGILLQALKNGSWVLLDELNLAPQSVLEGLNAILDHRAEVFIPELGHTFKCPSSFRVFACQNPTSQGGGRKGLPKSFLNRFTKVYVDELVEEDHLFICRSLHPSVPECLLKKLIAFNKRLYEDTMVNHKFGQSGSPWEFNLRDIIRSCQIIEGAPESSKDDCFLNTVYVQRMRSSTDRQEVIRLYEEVFGVKPFINLYPRVQISPENLIVGNTYVKRNITQSSTGDLKILPGIRQSLETVAQCLNHQWLVLLIGPAASGKTSMIRLMSQLTGNVLNELNLSSATDISELLGCFEQYNAIRHYRLAIDQVKRYMNAYLSRQIESPAKSSTKQSKLIEEWCSFSSSIDNGSTSSVGNPSREIFRYLPLVVAIIEILQLDNENDCEDLDRLMKTVRKLQDDQRKLIYPAKFEWVTGMLIKAIQYGEWIMLENANLCNPTVLDRINSLVEQSGSITVNECGTVEGKPMVLRPHPEFRMFLTVNPTYGEVSRAMRNRGVEIYLTNSENELEEVKRFLVLSNIPGEHLVDAMAKAHLFAKSSGSQHNACISNLELGRWVQLFQQLLINGNQALWSLKFSFDNTYLSSLGANEGKDIINEAIGSYLSINLKSCSDSSLCLPGGWPTPLMVRDFVLYSTETSVRQNCMYLEFLGSQIASHSARIALGSCPMEFVQCRSNSMRTYVTDLGMLHDMVFPKADVAGLNTTNRTQFDVALTYKKLMFAANWSIEQATINNLKVYVLWLGWLSDQLQGYCSFFSTFLKLLNEEMNHSSWNYIRQSHEVLHKDLISQPMLSLDHANLTGNQHLINAVKCVGLLRLSHQQWHTETEYKYSDKTRCFIPVLESLRTLEKRILAMLVESPVFDVLFELYKKLIDDHISAWNGLVSSQFDNMLISWRSLSKHVKKLKDFCANEVEKLQDDMKNLERSLSWSLNSQRSLLWAYGGHPFSPSSAEIHTKQQQLVNLCSSIWTTDTSIQEQGPKGSIEAAVSSNYELRFLAMQGVCMSAFIMSQVGEGDLDVLKQMEEMYQTLLSKFNYEKDKLEKYLENTEQASFLGDVSSCCVINTDTLCQPAGLSCWLDTLPLNDYNSFGLDMRLLLELSNIVSLDGKELESGLSRLRWLLESTLKFSLNFSSRPPTDFSPYQKLSWVLDAWTSVDSAHASISSTVLEMWFNWHTSLWKHHSNREEKSLSQHAYADLVPDMLFQPVATKSLDKILRDPIGIKNLNAHRLKLGLASRNLWLSSPHIAECHRFFLLSARSLFQQIILAHEKSFEAENFLSIKSIFFSAQQADVSDITSLLASSTHHVLKSLIPFIKPLLQELYAPKSTDSLFHLGGAWLRIGSLRYHLLQCCDDVDPAVKKNLKYILLNLRIALLELEIEVRRECVHLAGCFSLTEVDKEMMDLLNDLKAERNRRQRQVVFRSDTGKYKKLRSECDEFLKLVATPLNLLRNMANLNLQQVAEQVHNWQETATRVVDRLSNEYSQYVDILQPVQVAIYEMKLGLSLVLSSCMRNQYLDRVGQKNIDVILGAVYSFIRFPRGIAAKDDSCMEENLHDKLSYFDKSFPTYMSEDDMNMVETLVTSARDNNVDEAGSVLQIKAAIHQNILLRVVHYVAQAHFLDNASFKLLDRMFDEFANLWMKMKIQVRTKEELDSRQYRFKPRDFDLKNVIEMDVTTLESSNEAFSEWQELASEEVEASVEKNNVDEEQALLEKDWDLLLESMLNEMVNVYNTIFGSTDLLQPAGHVQVSDSDRLRSFLDSYALGTRVIKDLDGLMCSSLESKLIPEHVLRLCLEHDRNSVASHLPKNAYNFYKDSNASLLAKMVDPVIKLQQRIRHLLTEWDDHPALQKIVDVIDMILSIPMNTPLAKAMSGLQFLLNRVRNLQETVAKFPLSAQLDPIIALVSTWQKMEFESWPALLDEVQARFDTNAGQLWFPLYSVLRQTDSNDSQSIMQSLEEFIQTSSIGEFRKRLQLVFAFHGHISTAINHESNSSCGYEDSVKILYNTFGFCVQFLPNVMEQLASNRKTIEAELNELLKLCKWDRNEWYMTMETSKRTREKFKKLIQKYTDVLKQPVMLIFTEEAARRGINTMANHVPTTFSDTFDKYKQVLDVACHETLFKSKKRFIWSPTWRNKVDLAMEDMRLASTAKPDYQCVRLDEAEANVDIVGKFINGQSSSDTTKEEWRQIRYTFEKISTNLVNCGELWKDEKKRSAAKNRAYSDLLKLLDDWGLAKHRSRIMEDRWYLQSSYSMEHLLLKEGRLASGKLEVAALENLQTDWKTANEYFFKSLHSLGHLRDICSKFHQDFELEKVKRSESYLGHLVEIQTKHRASAYSLAEGLERLKKCSLPLLNLFTNSQLSHNQDIVFNCMLRQKQLFDTMCSTLNDECLLLTSVENNHLSCQSVGAAASQIRVFLEKFVPDFRKSKELLEEYLFGECGSLVNTSVVLHPYGITKQMEQLVQHNFLLIRDFKEQLNVIRKQDVHAGLAKYILLDHFEEIFTKGNLLDEYYNSALEARNQSRNLQDAHNISKTEARFAESLRKTCKHIVDGFEGVNSENNKLDSSEDYFSNIKTWQETFDSRVTNLQLDTVHDELVKTLNFAGELTSLYGSQESLSHVEAQLKYLYSLLDLMITFGNGLLSDFMVAHRTLSMVTHVLAEIFASFYKQGFGCTTEDQEDDGDKTQDATGTGMGEGAGAKDVSEQIEDEDQLLGTKKGEEKDALNDNVPSKDDKGIEMEQDFNADAFDVSEDENDDENEDETEEPELDSAMGETGDDSEVVDEKLRDNKDDENDENPDKNEKYETGPSVKDDDRSNRELRAKEDDPTTTDEAGELDPDESNKQNEENDDQAPDDGTDDVEDMNIDKDEAFAEPTGLKPDAPDVGPDDDIDMNQQDDIDHNEEDATETVDESAELNEAEEESNQENPEENGTETVTETSEMETEENNQENKTDADVDAPKNDVTAPVANDFGADHQSNDVSATQPNGRSSGTSMREVAPEATWSNTNDLKSDLAPINGLPNSSENEISVADSSKGGKLNDEHISQLPELDPSSLQKNEPNPFRNIGDALDGWKERAKVSVDLEEKKDEPMEELMDEEDVDADEYGFTSGIEKGTAQALGPAAADQIDNNIEGKEPTDENGDGGIADKKDDSEMDVDEQHVEAKPAKNNPLNIGNTVHEKMEVVETEIPDEIPEVYNPNEVDERNGTGSLVHMERSYMTDNISQFNQLSVGDDDMGMAHDLEDVSGDKRDSATALWRKYELKTTQLSQELAEQLRLVMEPTLASKLQGDYKTGKRINMKKVIPYIASHYRKDKIWLRRTRPNKRNYQVVIAIDDSSSMSENNNGSVAIEALVTVCRAMSQLEVGSLAVASFGKEGNIQLLHDFDLPFTAEAGVKMLSSLTFKQENTLNDKPMVELLKYLNNTLDSAAMNARLPSGQNPLEQLVIIIADGNLHERENLKRRVNDLLSKNRMVAFLVLDKDPENSIEVLPEVIYKDKKLTTVKYMDSFPFPFYVILKDIETLPRTLADLLRQWFELMQH